MNNFKERPNTVTYAQHVIFDEQERLLNDIAAILLTSNVNYKVIISPGYDQIKRSKEDYKVLCAVFGADKV